MVTADAIDLYRCPSLLITLDWQPSVQEFGFEVLKVQTLLLKAKGSNFLNIWARLRRFYILFDENLNFWTTLQVLTPRARNVKTRTRCDHIRKKFWISPSFTLRKMLLKDLLPTLSTTLFSSHNFIPISYFNSILKFLSPIVQ